MTYKEAEAICIAQGYTNPRYIAYYAHVGKEPSFHEWALWISDKWKELAKIYGHHTSKDVMCLLGVGKAQAEFDRFIGVEERS